MNIALASDTVTNEDLKALSEWIVAAPKLTKGPLTDAFEEKAAETFGSKYAVFVNSGSSANLIAASALLYGNKLRNKRVVIPTVSWITTATPFYQLGFELRFCDCDTTNLGVDLTHLRQICEEFRPDCMILVHVLGHDSNIQQVMEICAEFDVMLIEDTCEAIGSKVNGKYLGTFADMGTFSFYFGHQLSTIEGGLILTDDFYLSQVCRSLRAHGWSRDLDPEFRDELERRFNIEEFQNLYTFYYPGYNCRPTDLNAFLGLRQLDILDEVVSARQRNYQRYAERLDSFWQQKSSCHPLSSFAYGTIVENREDLARQLRSNGVECRPLICGSVAHQPVFRSHFDGADLPNGKVVDQKGIYFPNHAELTLGDVDRVCDVVLSEGVPASFLGEATP